MAKLPRDTITHYEHDGKGNINITITDLIRCKDCKHRVTDNCPMFNDEWKELYDGDEFYDEYFFHDDTVDSGYCHKGELRGDSDDSN